MINSFRKALLVYGLVIISFDFLVFILGGIILQGSNDGDILWTVNLLMIAAMITLPLLFLLRLRQTVKIEYWKRLLFVLFGLTLNFSFVVILNTLDLFDRINSHQEYLDGMKATFILNFLFLFPLGAISIIFVKNKR